MEDVKKFKPGDIVIYSAYSIKRLRVVVRLESTHGTLRYHVHDQVGYDWFDEGSQVWLDTKPYSLAYLDEG